MPLTFRRKSTKNCTTFSRNVRDTSSCRTMTARSSAVCTAIFFILAFRRNNPLSQKAGATYGELIITNYDPRPYIQPQVSMFPAEIENGDLVLVHEPPAARCGRSIPEEGGGNMDDHNEMYEIGLTAPMEMAEEYRLDEMLPMMGLKIGKRCIILISRSVNAAEILDTLETLRCAEEKADGGFGGCLWTL